MFKKLNNQKGFTLVELLIAVIIIGILSAILIPKVSNVMDKAKETKLSAAMSSVTQGASVYMQKTNGNNMTLDGLNKALFDDAYKLVKKVSTAAESDTAIYTTTNYKNVWGYPIEVMIKNLDEGKGQILITSNKTATTKYTTSVYYVNGQVDDCTLGFDTDKNLENLKASITTCGVTP